MTIVDKIRGRDSGGKSLIIAEAGINHNGDLGMAQRLIEAAVAAGADAVKFQTLDVDKLVIPGAPKANYQVAGSDDAEDSYTMLKRVQLGSEAFVELKECCEDHGILFLSTPFDEDSARLLNKIGVAAFKVASGDLNNLPFLRTLASFGAPIILSTGMADLGEVEQSMATLREAGAVDVILLHCVSQYPAPPELVNLRAMVTLREQFGVPTGFSDHTLGVEVAFAAAALGAVVIEKHFTLDQSLAGPDHQASLMPDELKALVGGVRRIEMALGTGEKKPAEVEHEVALVARKSLTTACEIKAGSIIQKHMIQIMRPGTGLSPARLDRVIGQKAKRNLPQWTTLQEDDLE